MFVTLSGIVIDVSPEQPENAQVPMLVTLSGIVTDVRPEQPEKASFPTLVTPSGMTRFTISSPFRNKRWAQQRGLDSAFEKEIAHHADRSEMRTASSL